MSEKERDCALFLEDMLTAIQKIDSYMAGFTFEEFSGNDMAIDAVIRPFEIIGEAANNVPKRLRSKYPGVEWREAVGFRNVLAHHYFGIDVEAIWDTVKKNLPALKKHILEVLEFERLGRTAPESK
jgi:uncharacterized protein with HEPN domain